MIKDLEALIRRCELAQERFKDLEEYFCSSKSILEDREEFKKWLERGKQNTKKVDELESKLEQQPCDDCVSRQAVLDLAVDYGTNSATFLVPVCSVKSLPPVTPTRKSGMRWIERFDNEDKWLECPHCHKDSDNAYAYCPNCGASFKEEKRGTGND